MKIKLEKTDYRRILLTEVLPYEIPIIYTNIGLYEYNDNKEKSVIAKTVFSQKETIPFSYKIIKNADSYRTLHLIHPANQISFVKFYSDYKDLITSLCSRCTTSLRAPSSVATHFYEKTRKKPNKIDKLKDEDIEIEPETKIEKEPNHASSFFSYRKYSFLYKFYDSYEFHRCEKKFSKLRKFDISKCFDSLSTRSLGISIKDEIYQKINSGSITFEDKFSTLMENANFGRKNGIVIGPEFSRIFAEIILQRIDQSAINILSQKKPPLVHEVDFSIRRYVDDYFLFYNNDAVKTEVYATFTDELEKYRLFINQSKINDSEVPFITGTTVAKKEIQSIFDNIFPMLDSKKEPSDEDSESSTDLSKLEQEDENKEPPLDLSKIHIKACKQPSQLANKIIRDIKCIIKNNEISYWDITGYFLSGIKSKISRYDSNKINGSFEQKDALYRFMMFLLDVLFFVYANDIRVRSTYLVSQIILTMKRISEKLDHEHMDGIQKKIEDEVSLVSKKKTADPRTSGVENLNLILAMSEIFPSNKMTNDDLSKFATGFVFGELKNNKILNYFQIISILYYIKNDGVYAELHNFIIHSSKVMLEKNCITMHAESALLFFDLMSCPHITNESKKIIIETVCNKAPAFSHLNVDSEFSYLTNRKWFTEWDPKVSIERLLMKKELKTPYP
ncbi:antiviral reverse transcriptase Drt3b [Vogesella sp. AC12]|uniref:antiviral reverse transcriptase Drt3b n=1 Tax=Vogesella sp. AC12 TaxID=2950550 RepID=UPI00210D9ED2|nr:antiviral reverse transcriptase Drt3b [Vogesella sp. AC12]MCQ4143197.1 RNA-directed DNA polymerase [Vogesella sp. AC12]